MLKLIERFRFGSAGTKRPAEDKISVDVSRASRQSQDASARLKETIDELLNETRAKSPLTKKV